MPLRCRARSARSDERYESDMGMLPIVGVTRFDGAATPAFKRSTIGPRNRRDLATQRQPRAARQLKRSQRLAIARSRGSDAAALRQIGSFTRKFTRSKR